MKFALGQAVPRTEDPRLLTGRGRYTDDFVLPRLAHAHVLRSPYAHAGIRSIDIRSVVNSSGEMIARLVPMYPTGSYWVHILTKDIPQGFSGTPLPCGSQEEMLADF